MFNSISLSFNTNLSIKHWKIFFHYTTCFSFQSLNLKSLVTQKCFEHSKRMLKWMSSFIRRVNLLRLERRWRKHLKAKKRTNNESGPEKGFNFTLQFLRDILILVNNDDWKAISGNCISLLIRFQLNIEFRSRQIKISCQY